MSNKQAIEILVKARAFAKKFIEKVESGRAHSRETYADMKTLVQDIDSLPEPTGESRYQIAKEVLTEFAREISQKPEKAMQLVNITYEMKQWLEEKNAK